MAANFFSGSAFYFWVLTNEPVFLHSYVVFNLVVAPEVLETL
jgi:hypothetical protein